MSHTPPRHVATAAPTWRLHGAEASRRIEQAALASVPPHTLMARAGLATARLAVALHPHSRRTLVLAGPGNNGGDGLVAAAHLAALGRDVRVALFADPGRLPRDAAQALQLARQAGVTFTDTLPSGKIDGDELLIDALLGLGTRRAPEGAIADAIQAANRGPAPVLAVDLPSGLDADHGRVLGAAAIRARWTISLLTLKPGLFTTDGRDHAGDTWLDTLGVDTGAEAPVAMLGCADPSPPTPRRHAQHKGSFGDVLVVGGSAGMSGAPLLAARAALRAGAGRVYLSPLDPTTLAPPPAWPELMLRPRAWEAAPGVLDRCTVVCGCGGGNAVAAALPALLRHAARLVLDADALNALAADAALGALLESRGRRGAPTVLTPHPLEAARLLGADTARVQSDRIGAARELASRFGAVVLLKGSGSVVARDEGAPWINLAGNALLATPGSGDVLAGWIGGDWSARGDSGAAWNATRHAVWRHGAAADRWALCNQLPMPASRLADLMSDAGARARPTLG